MKRKIVKNVFMKALEERFACPAVGANIEERKAVIERVSFDLEESVFLASGKFSETYVPFAAELIAHISPRFYSARHSFVFRDLLALNSLRSQDGSITDEINIARQSRDYLWPEIFNNRYFSPKEYREVLDIRTTEVNLAVLMLEKLITRFSEMPNETSSEMPNETSSDVSFSMLDETSTQRLQVCFQDKSLEVDVDHRTVGRKGSTEYDFCMCYEDFIMLFAENDMAGSVYLPNSTEKLSSYLADSIRKINSKEIKMARLYVDILRSLASSN